MKRIYLIVIFLLPFYLFGQDNWISDKNGCKVFNPFPRKHESVEWTGECKDSFAEGKGTLTWFLRGRKTQNVFQGIMVKGKPEGEGKYVFSDDTELVGEFRNGYFYKGTKKEKSGKTIYEYIGYFKNNEIEGKGELIVKGYYHYIGEFESGVENGLGIQYLENGDVFDGTFLDGYYVKGKMTLRDGKIIIGEFKDFQPYFGEIIYPDENRYKGSLKDFYPHGKGVLYFTDGGVFKCSWKNGLATGFGEYKLSNEVIYKAKWKNGKINGEGQIIYPNGKINKGIWSNGELIKEIEQ